jgi:hypothetical protein
MTTKKERTGKTMRMLVGKEMRLVSSIYISHQIGKS